ncbi:MAG: sigma-54-dependent Fis family transcriptional regulator, partial [Planctomycetes bacterium]|nr:sigma-54-dependent Fis family transcriptional regulator [Planctomycetota bacterium]
VKGAFTGAAFDREGKFEYAAGGTLFLDEVGEMPLATQIKLLRVLEERAVARVGDNKMRPVDVRVLAATNADLLQKVKDGSFRQDLYFRLKVVTIDLPPLRERRSDIKLLATHFLAYFAKLHGKDVESIDRDALVALVQYEWPGNVRELRNAIESMVVRARGNILTRGDLPPEIWAPLPTDQDAWQFLAGRTWQEVERNHIRVSLELTAGNRQKAAKAMGLSERTLYRKIKEYGL